MSLSQSMSMRMDQRQLLTPRMIQSMEILQLPLMALQERIEQELQSNPVLELRQVDPESPPAVPSNPPEPTDADGERQLVVDSPGDDGAADFERLSRIADYLENEEFATDAPFRPRAPSLDGERDGKLEAMANSAARGVSLTEHLLNQWALLEIPANLDAAGKAIIQHLDEDGYLRTPLEEVQRSMKHPATLPELQEALKLVQTLEPAGVGARNLPECLLIQLDAIEEDEELAAGHDFELERALLRNHLRDLELNRYPQISKALGRDISQIKAAVRRLSRLHPHPGKLISRDEAPPITPDATVYFDPETGQYEIAMAREPAENLYISGTYRRMLKDKSVDRKTREYLNNSVRNARWLLESIAQRSSTLKRVIRVVVDAQREFFERGPEALRPLPMTQVADQLGIHVATVSRAVSEKWIQTPRGIFPLRRFFSQGTTNAASGEDVSWDAVKEKLKQLIASEDKSNPLNDDQIVAALKAQGLDLARRTVAKYRKILGIPVARQRRQF
ncbi:MAG: RNA polymerase factor sigma-54 [Phycisphaerales bacterium]|nr:RNA polymerase factor sigma-54 [Phycisphaerales bacterium]